MEVCWLTFLVIISWLTLNIDSMVHHSNGKCPTSMPYDCICLDKPLEVQCLQSGLDHIPEDLPDEILLLIFRENHFNIIDYIPVVYKTIISLSLDQNQIRFLRDNAFQDLSNLEELYLENNQISGLHNTSFKGLTSVRLIDLQYNHLYETEEATFSAAYIPLVERINLSSCKLYSLHGNTFKDLTNLRRLDISHNSFNLVSVLGDENSFPKLEKLNLSYNGIGHYLNRSFFQFMPALTDLDLTGNRIQTVQTRAWDGLEDTLQILSLRENNLHYIEDGAFSGLRALRQLDVSYNRLQLLEIPDAFWLGLNQALVHHNEWHCGCHTEWMMASSVVLWNDNQSLICSSPQSMVGRQVLSVQTDQESQCLAPTSSKVLHPALVVSIACASFILLLLVIECMRRRLRAATVTQLKTPRGKFGIYRRMEDLAEDGIANQDL
ncbi:hypothetical protein CAPTEDRAFT_159275 [Capitella teleta]|uniref:LRRCT domain-containing protein n=1 Tax=Capitella teleta TaxID=283909 RepID=R7TZC2_CAPTE|nr:hypothetical protein CAPTEDRAFT_159275 [Capitella teleta]|eukprot:ELT98977.1 hypothetical protein CAPTEDRAFT_159275 [Capitella teleta]